MPEISVIEEVILMLNPIYDAYFESAERLLSRMGFKTMFHKLITLSDEDSANLFKEKVGDISVDHSTSYSFTNGEKLSKFLGGSQVHMWHLTKLSGDREVRAIFNDGQIDLEDVFSLKIRSTPFKPIHFPYIFLFMDSPYMFEAGFSMLWGPRITEITGQLLIDGMEFNERKNVLEFALQVTVGDTIKELQFDRLGNIVTNAESTLGNIITKLP